MMTNLLSKIHPSATIHPSAIIADGAVIGKDVNVGPYCVIGAQVILNEGVKLISHICVDGITTIGANSLVYPFASIGHNPQDLKYNGEPSTVIIGENTTIREYVTIQPGTASGGMATTVGNNCLLMVGVHVAHDCHVGNNVVMANYATLAGHVVVGDHVVVGGLSAAKQFVRIGAHAMIGGMSGVEKDVLPYALIMGERANMHGVNIVGMKRHGYSNADIQKVQTVYQGIFNEDDAAPFSERVQKQRESIIQTNDDRAMHTVFEFMDAETKCHFCGPKSAHR